MFFVYYDKETTEEWKKEPDFTKKYVFKAWFSWSFPKYKAYRTFVGGYIGHTFFAVRRDIVDPVIRGTVRQFRRLKKTLLFRDLRKNNGSNEDSR